MNRAPVRHAIIGTEVGQPRPPAYMRRGHTRRSRPRRARPDLGLWAALALAVALAILLLRLTLAG